MTTTLSSRRPEAAIALLISSATRSSRNFGFRRTHTAQSWDAPAGPCSTSLPSRERTNGMAAAFTYLRDRDFDAAQPYAPDQPDDRQQQFGGTLGGPIRKDRIFFYAGFDQHLLTVPSVVQFANGTSSIVPQPGDYDYKDQALVFAAAQQLTNMGGTYPTTMQGNAGFAKVDFNLSPRQLAFVRLSTSQLTGTNNVFFDPSSPITNYAVTGNGTETVNTESIAASLISSWITNLATNLRFQFSRDLATIHSEFGRTLDQDLRPGRRLWWLQHPSPRHAREQAAHRRYGQL